MLRNQCESGALLSLFFHIMGTFSFFSLKIRKDHATEQSPRRPASRSPEQSEESENKAATRGKSDTKK
jgi:hypothetical protein